MMELLEDVFIRCDQCGKVTGIHKEDFDFESYVYDRGENGMGEEIEYRPTAILNATIAAMKSLSEFPAMNTQ